MCISRYERAVLLSWKVLTSGGVAGRVATAGIGGRDEANLVAAQVGGVLARVEY
jgi:hypothetical protein